MKNKKTDKSNKKGFRSVGKLLLNYDFDKNKYITQEFQDYGYRLAVELGDEKNASLYIKLAKEDERINLEKARVFVKDANNVRSKKKLFMWSLKKREIRTAAEVSANR